MRLISNALKWTGQQWHGMDVAVYISKISEDTGTYWIFPVLLPEYILSVVIPFGQAITLGKYDSATSKF